MIIKFASVTMREPDRFSHHWYRDNANVVQRDFILEYDMLPANDVVPLLLGPFLTSFQFTCINPYDDTETAFTVRGKDITMGVLYEVSGDLFYKDVVIILARVV